MTTQPYPPTRYQIAQEVVTERNRQIALGYTWPHDDEHGIGHIISEVERRLKPDDEPWDRSVLVKCAALLIASIEAFDRAAIRDVSGSADSEAQGSGSEADRG